jgi:phosphatidylinositol alpha-mannosyltransferase
MRVAITHPTCWPEIRRGSERLLHDLSHWLADRGHDVTVISTIEGPARVEQEGNVVRRLLTRAHPLPVRTRWWNFFHAFAGQVRAELATGGFDAVHCLNYHDAWGATRARRQGRFRLVFQLTGIPLRRYFRRIPLDGLIFQRVIRDADEILALSTHALGQLHDQYRRAGRLVAAPTDLRPYSALPKTLAAEPLILFVGDADEPRKGALLLAQATELLWTRGLALRLAYSGRASAATRETVWAAVPEACRERVVFHGVGQTTDLPALYAAATVVVNPAIWEAQGMVLVEALAAGTPVVGCDHAGTPDIIAAPGIGHLFHPGATGVAASNARGLADAIAATIALAADPQTAIRCRRRADLFSWDRVGPLYEAALLGIADPSIRTKEPAC